MNDIAVMAVCRSAAHSGVILRFCGKDYYTNGEGIWRLTQERKAKLHIEDNLADRLRICANVISRMNRRNEKWSFYSIPNEAIVAVNNYRKGILQ